MRVKDNGDRFPRRKRLFTSVFHSVSKSGFVHNVAAVVTGVAAAQAISLMFMPFIARIYGPEAFGVLAAFTSIANIAAPVATLGYAGAIVMPETDEEASAVARLSLVCAAVVAPVTTLLIFLFNSELAAWTGLERDPHILYLIPVSLLFVAFLSVADQSAIRAGAFQAKAKAKVISAFLINVGKLFGGFVMPTGLVLIFIDVASKGVNFVALIALVPRHGIFRLRSWFGVSGIKEAARAYKDFSIYRMPQTVLNAVAVGMPIIILTALSGAESAGQYSLTVLVLGVPVVLLGESVGEVFYPKITSAIRRKSPDAYRQLLISTLTLVAIAFLPFGAVAVFGPQLFTFILGEQWSRAGDYAQWIAPWLALTLVTRPVISAFPVLKLQSYFLIQEIPSVVFRSAALVVGIKYWGSDLVGVALFSIVGSLFMFSHIIVAFWRLIVLTRKWNVVSVV